jgi:hypothetical protein
VRRRVHSSRLPGPLDIRQQDESPCAQRFCGDIAMKFNRDHYLMAGLVLLLLGIQLRLVDTFVLNERTSNYLAERMAKRQVASASGLPTAIFTQSPFQTESRRRIQPQRWIGWSLVSIGGVCVLHSLILKKQ